MLHVFHVDDLVWTEWMTAGDSNKPKTRAFHSATVVGDYMVIFGRYLSLSHEEIIRTDNLFIPRSSSFSIVVSLLISSFSTLS